MSFRAVLLMCVCVSSLASCGHPIRDLVDEAKELIPKDEVEESCPAQATSRIELVANLREGGSCQEWDPSDPEGSAAFVVAAAPYTREGRAVSIQLFFVRVAPRFWEWHVLGAQRGAGAELGSGALQFDAAGALVASELPEPLRVALSDGSLSAPIAVHLGNPKDEGHDGFDGVSASAERSRLDDYVQDGHAALVGESCP